MKFRISQGAGFFLLGQRKTVFVESSQQIFEVDDVTAFLTCALSEPLSLQELVSALAARGAGQATARTLVQKYLAHWSRLGLLDIVLDEEEGPPVRSLVADLAGTAVSIACHDHSLANLVLPVFEHQRVKEREPSIVYELASLGNTVCISRNRARGMIVAANAAAPALKAMLTDDVLAGLRRQVALHAALLVKNRQGLLLCGAPGAGKTTLALALLRADFACGGDDIALLDEDGLVQGVPFAPAVKRGSWGLIAGMREAIAAAPIHRRLDGKTVRYLASIPYAPHETVPLHSIVLLRRRRNGPVSISAVEPARVLSELLSGAFTPARRLDLAQFETLLGALRRARTVELSYARLDEAVAALSQHHAAA
ncbi:serine kinase [Ensifer adhaerens]|uniref:serine kinase n=1 Tax=Ensifer adhaerens TaxID=106592 RepID=UPI00098EDC7E|nr:serine kinase [Ensifer adhaerens]